ncbi:MAG TPA: SDR family oxidoreductase [Gemmatimonadaceae bacterium]
MAARAPGGHGPGEGPLAGRLAVVTGASRGIGLACARALAGAGARVAMIARGLEALEAAALSVGAGAIAVAADLALSHAAARAADEVVSAFGAPPDLLVSNAGMFALARVEDTDPAQLEGMLATNLVAPFLLARALIPGMRAAGRGDLVTIGSIADRVTFPENGAYAASKFGARAMHQVLRAELAGSGVRAILVSPGPVDTPLWDPIDPDTRPGFTPRAAMLPPEAVADAVLWAVTRPAAVNVDELRLSHS